MSDEPATGPGDGDPPAAASGIVTWFAKNTVASNIIMFVLLVGGLVLVVEP